MLVDLFLGGQLGLWVLDQVDSSQIGLVYSKDKAICDRASDLGFSRDCEPQGEVGLSMHYPHILELEFLVQYQRIYNIHPALLPWGRSYYPVFWALWADEPAGCTLHVIQEGIDDGPIVEQWAVPKYEWDTGGTLHARVSEAEKGLFLKYWPRIAAGEELETKDQEQGGSFHCQSEFIQLKSHEGDVRLLKLIRCLSHPDHTGLVVKFGERHYEVSARAI